MNPANYLFIGLAIYLLSILFIYRKHQNNYPISLLLENNGIFRHDKASGITCILSGFLLMGLFVFIGFKDNEATLSGLFVGLGLGVFFSLVGLCFLLFNFKSYFIIENEHIQGKYHYFGKIDCSIHDVVFAMGRNKTLIIKLKDGKVHTIMGIENAWQLASIIRKKIIFDVVAPPETLIEELNNLKSANKKHLICLCFCFVLMFVNIFITVFMTGGREMHEFTKTDWIIFAIMGAIEIATVIATFYFAQKKGKNNIPIEHLRYIIQRRTVETHPLLSGNIIKVFTDEHYMWRITLYGYPNNDSVYYVVQEFASDFTFFKSYESEIFENIEQLEGAFDALIDITNEVLH